MLGVAGLGTPSVYVLKAVPASVVVALGMQQCVICWRVSGFLSAAEHDVLLLHCFRNSSLEA